MTGTTRAALLVAAIAWGIAGPAAAQELTIGLSGNVTSADPHFHNLSPNSNVAAHVYDRLVHQDARQRIGPGLAVSWKPIDDLTWEFKLRTGVRFHDGSEFSAEDVVATLKRVPWVPNSPSPFTLYTRSIVATEVVDSHTIRFRTRSPWPLLPNDLATVSIVSRKAVEASTGDFNSGKAAIGTGPFRFGEFVPNDRVTLVRNDSYWGPKPHWQKVTLKLIINDASRTAALLAGDVQMIEAVPTTDLARLKQSPQIAVQQITSNRLIYLAIDQARDESPFVADKAGGKLVPSPLRDLRVRQAISKAINRQAIVERIFEGAAIPAGGFLPEGFFGASPKLKPEAFDAEGARRLLAAAGVPSGFVLTLHGPNDRYPNDDKVLQAIGPMLNRVGIDAKVVSLPWATFATQASAPHYAYSVSLLGWGSGTGEVSSPLRALVGTPNAERGTGAANRGRFSHPQVDELTAKAMSTVDDAAREKLLQAASEVAIGEQGIIPLYYQINTWATRKGITYEPRSDEYSLAQFVHPAP
ncbi:MAG: ABC transporter substrate-binding protein [Alphaproteobacteria bacterium]|nr:ABC transporter substrate-binding protein [Alphaproteobacteria bacterium]